VTAEDFKASPPPAQEQFLRTLSREEAIAAFRRALKPKPLGTEEVPLANLLGRVLAAEVVAPVDTPPFDRSVVDGFAVRSDDLRQASQTGPVLLELNDETIACGMAPAIAVEPNTATYIATGGPVPRGADAVVMIEHTNPGEGRSIAVHRAISPGQNIAFAGSDIARGQTVLHKGAVISALEIGMLAAVGKATATVWRRPRVAVLSTGNELVAPGEVLPPAAVYDSNGAIIAAALEENNCVAVRQPAIPDDQAEMTKAVRAAFLSSDAVILSGGTSKGAGDLTYRIVERLGKPGIIVHGVALKPGKPLCLAVCDGKPVVVLPGFPTSAMFTFHDIVAPILRIMAGLPARQDNAVQATVPVRVPSELGRAEFVMVGLSHGPEGLVAHPVGKGSGAVTAFSQADGFFAIDALAEALPAGSTVEVKLLASHLRIPDLVIMGSHCIGLDAVVSMLIEQNVRVRVLALGSLGGLAALKRAECDIAPIHLLEPETGAYNESFLSDGMRLIKGWRRMQGLVFRPGDKRFEGRSIDDAVAAALADPQCLMVNRNQGSGTRVLIHGLLKGAQPPGYWNQPRAHNAVAASVAQMRADWGVAIKQAADALELEFIPLAEEHYDFAVLRQPRNGQALASFEATLSKARARLEALGFAMEEEH
jgi:molybdopterin molybdotransferase/putative molybdopterin biosynthesis protein